jgi:hypothetical protein
LKDDRAEIGFIDLKNYSHWTKIGGTMAWNWQQVLDNPPKPA